MNDIGYIRLHRKFWNNPTLNAGERFTRYDAWLWILTNANFENGAFTIKGKTFHIKRGQYRTTIRHLSTVWHWDKTTVARFLSDIETEKMITAVRTQNGTLITVLNYNKYQGSGGRGSTNADNEQDTESDVNSPVLPPAKSTLLNKENKNSNEIKGIRRGRRVIE